MWGRKGEEDRRRRRRRGERGKIREEEEEGKTCKGDECETLLCVCVIPMTFNVIAH